MITPVLPTYARADIAFERGEGVWLEATDGRRYLDFGAGIAVNSFGHAHPHLVEALVTQAGRLWHTSNLYRIPGQERLAARLVAATFADTVFFTNSGAEALECSIKMARKHHAAAGRPERYVLITFEGAFHGRTLATLAAGGQEKYLDGFGPRVEGFRQVPFGDLAAVRGAVGEDTAGILIEPIQGEGGIHVADRAFMRALRRLCDEAGLLLVLDEVQCGVGRTGRLFAHEWSDIVPDIMAIAKAIGGGFPLGACLATERAAAGMTLGSHGSTFGGNPLAAAVGNAVLDVVLGDGFLQHVRDRGLRLSQKLAMLADEHPSVIAEVRGTGLMLGLKARVPSKDLLAAMLDQNLLAIGAGDNVVRIMPPLIIGDAEIDDGIGRIDAACRAIEAGAAPVVAGTAS